MMDCIILEDNENDVAMAGKTATKDESKTKKFEKRLIRQVCNHRIIYDHKHKLFSNVAKKDAVWQQIADKLKVDVNLCKSTWAELRYKYQCHVRRLRKHFLNIPKKNRKRPVMDFESELLFLWRYIDNSKCCAIPFEIEEPITEPEEVAANVVPENETIPPLDDDLILIEQPVECIVIDEDDDTKCSEKLFHVTDGMRALVEEVKKYPELYDSTLPAYNDYSRKSSVWNTIACQVGDKATKLMKSWILMQTRYEWEISRNQQNMDVAKHQTPLQEIMEYFEPFIVASPDTVFKHSYYLKQSWHEPMSLFKDIYNLIARLRRVPDVVYLTDVLINKPEKNAKYFEMWNDIPKIGNNTIGQYETTWLIMRLFYWELMNMRKHNYQLTDKWYFEIVITELYDLVRDCKLAKEQAQLVQTPASEHINTALSHPASTLTTTVQQPPAQQLTPPPPPPAQPPMTSQQTPLPKITSAISLAPQAMSGVGGPLQIRPISVPQLNVMVQAPQQQLFINSVHSQVNLQMPLTQFSNNAVIPAATLHSPQVFAKPTLINSTTPQAQFPKASAVPSTKTKTPLITVKPKRVNVASIGLKVATTSLPISTTTTIKPLTAAPPAITMSQLQPVMSKPPSQNAMPTTSAQVPLPKIGNAVSLLNPNEILIELIASQNGNHLVVHGPPLSEKYHLSMPLVAKFIREILAIPLLHNKRHNQPNLINSYWEHIAQKFFLPPHICRACWNFLVENFAHFPQIAPLKELMKPFSTTLNVWTESNKLFKAFDVEALSKGWLVYISRLPEAVECIGDYPVLYKDVDKSATNSNTEMEALCAWRTVALRFPAISDIQHIWTSFKSVFCQYMSDIEFGIDNKWPINWWRVLARLKFLVEARYSTNEPYYYIVSNKMVEEIERCAMIEMKNRYSNTEVEATTGATAGTETQNISAVVEPVLDGRKWQVETVALLTAIQKHPVIYEKGDCMVKYEAWKSVAKELQMDVTDCLLSFRRACQKYCMYKKQDSCNRCPLNQRYFKRFDAIFRSVKPPSVKKLNIKTPFELNQSVVDDKSPHSLDDLVFPERYISDINMTNCDGNLVVKNWSYAIGNLSTTFNESVHFKLKSALKKHLPKIKSKTK